MSPRGGCERLTVQPYDIVIIGGGIIGCGIARELARYRLRIALCEAGTDVGAAASKANGGLVHSGYDPKPGTLKAKLNVEGNRLYSTWAEELGFVFERSGSLVLGFSDQDRLCLEGLARNAHANGVSATRLVGRDELLAIEPAASPAATYGFYCPHTGRVDPFAVAVACMSNAMANGVDLYLESPVNGIRFPCGQDGRFRVTVPGVELEAAYIINAAGLHADDVARLAGLEEYTISARHGDMLMLDKECGRKPKLALYPAPTAASKGVVVVPTVSGNILVGSTAVMRAKDDNNSYAEGIAELLAGAVRLAPGLNPAKVIRPFAGERAVADDYDNDFYIRPSAHLPNFFHVAGIQSPGVAAAPAIARYVVEMLRDYGVSLRERTDFQPLRTAQPDFSALSRAEQSGLIKKDSAYGRIVCRCETVTEAEIVAAIHACPPAVTLDAVKRRVRAGMGRCQSGFCQSRVLRILARELNCELREIRLDQTGSQVVLGKVK